MASTSKGQQKEGKKMLIMDAGGDLEEETTVPLSVSQALQNDLVLESIFSYLSVPDLKACRLVCQLWKQATRRILVEKCKRVRFVAKYTDIRNGYFLAIEEMVKLTSVLSTCNRSQFPVTKFLVDANIAAHLYGDTTECGEEILRQFFRAIGPLATELEIGFGFIDNGELFQLCAPLNTEFPRLKTLKLNLALTYLPRTLENIFQSNLAICQNILENAPQLSTLDISGDRPAPEAMDMLINLMERTVLGRKLSTLHLKASFHENHFARLADIGLRLTNLRLDLMYNSSLKEVGEGWMNFLGSQSDTLEELHVKSNGYRREEKLTVRLPQLRKLKRLTLASSAGCHILRFSGMFYTQQFPDLKHLSFGSFSNKSLETLLSSDIRSVSTVEILELPWLLYDPVWIWHAARIFPNVKKLKIPGRINIVRTVFQAWQTVEELILYWVNGQSVNELLAVNFHGLLPSHYRKKTSGEPDKFLQNLKTLRLEGFYDAPTARICNFVLLKMGSLRCLDLSKCNHLKISKYMLGKMRKQFVVLYNEKEEASQN